MGRPSNTQLRRAEIVAGMGRALARHGYAGATVADIAREAGLAPGLVHYHFDDKRSILLALVEDLAARLRVRAQHRDQEAANAHDRLLAFLDAAVALGPDADRDAVACWVAVSAEAVRDAEVRAVLARVSRELHRELAARVRAALRERGRSVRRARTHAAVLWAAVQGSYALSATAPSLLPRGAMAPALRALVFDLLSREEA